MKREAASIAEHRPAIDRERDWAEHWRRQRRLLKLVYAQATVILPLGVLINWATTVTATLELIVLHAVPLYVLGPLFISAAHVAIESPLSALCRMPETGTTHEISLRIACQAIGLAVAAVLTAILLEHFTPLRNLLSGPLLSGVSLVLAVLIVHTLVDAVRSRELAILRFRSLQAESRFRNLTEQVQPHFLFNALNALAELVHSNPAKAGDGILALARIYQTITDAAQCTSIPVAQEIDLVRSYLAVQKMRIGPRLVWTLTVDEKGILDVTIPPFTLLTLAENAIKHGVAQSSGQGRIDVSVSADGDQLILSVRNDKSHNGKIRDPSDRPGTGLANLEQRLVLAYGRGRARLALETRDSEVNATISLPRGSA